MLRSVVIPHWVLDALRQNSAPLETVLDPVKLSFILSPLDVGFYYASVDTVFSPLTQEGEEDPGIVRAYRAFFETVGMIHWSFFDMIEDAVDASQGDDERIERLDKIMAAYRSAGDEFNLAKHDEQKRGFIHQLAITMWRDSVTAYSGRLEGTEEGTPGYAPRMTAIPFPVSDETLFSKTGLATRHMDNKNTADRSVVVGVTFSPIGELESQQDCVLESYSAAMSAVGNFIPLEKLLSSDLLLCYLREKGRLSKTA